MFITGVVDTVLLIDRVLVVFSIPFDLSILLTPEEVLILLISEVISVDGVDSVVLMDVLLVVMFVTGVVDTVLLMDVLLVVMFITGVVDTVVLM